MLLLCCHYCVTGRGADYDSGPYSATFPAGLTIASFNVSIHDDNVFEHSETITLMIDESSLPSRVMAVPMCHLDIKIVDNDGKLVKTLSDLQNNYLDAEKRTLFLALLKYPKCDQLL